MRPFLDWVLKIVFVCYASFFYFISRTVLSTPPIDEDRYFLQSYDRARSVFDRFFECSTCYLLKTGTTNCRLCDERFCIECTEEHVSHCVTPLLTKSAY